MEVSMKIISFFLVLMNVIGAYFMYYRVALASLCLCSDLILSK